MSTNSTPPFYTIFKKDDKPDTFLLYVFYVSFVLSQIASISLLYLVFKKVQKIMAKDSYSKISLVILYISGFNLLNQIVFNCFSLYWLSIPDFDASLNFSRVFVFFIHT